MPTKRKKPSPLKGRRHKKWGTVDQHKRRVSGPKLNGVTAATLRSELKNRLKEDLGKQLVKRELATTKREKKKLSKVIRSTKSELKKLN